MKITKLLFVVSIFVLLVLAGCSSSADRSYAPSNSEQKYVGGGCGVGAPADDLTAARDVLAVESASAA